MTFNNIIESACVENITAVSVFDMVLAMVLSFGIGLFIFLIYKKPLPELCTHPVLV